MKKSNVGNGVQNVGNGVQNVGNSDVEVVEKGRIVGFRRRELVLAASRNPTKSYICGV